MRAHWALAVADEKGTPRKELHWGHAGLACDVAEKAAPYVHPKISPTPAPKPEGEGQDALPPALTIQLIGSAVVSGADVKVIGSDGQTVSGHS